MAGRPPSLCFSRRGRCELQSAKAGHTPEPRERSCPRPFARGRKALPYPRVSAPATASSEQTPKPALAARKPANLHREKTPAQGLSASGSECAISVTARHTDGMKIDRTAVIARFMRATQLDHLDKPGDDGRFCSRLDSARDAPEFAFSQFASFCQAFTMLGVGPRTSRRALRVSTIRSSEVASA